MIRMHRNTLMLFPTKNLQVRGCWPRPWWIRVYLAGKMRSNNQQTQNLKLQKKREIIENIFKTTFFGNFLALPPTLINISEYEWKSSGKVIRTALSGTRWSFWCWVWSKKCKKLLLWDLGENIFGRAVKTTFQVSTSSAWEKRYPQNF